MIIFKKAEILLPKTDRPEKWAVIACDQFTGQPEYWESLREFVGKESSALDLIIPEGYLKSDNSDEISKINAKMDEIITKGYCDIIQGYILVERTLNTGAKRLGLMLAVNLDTYDYSEKNTAPIKATEKTVVDRLPPRVKIREGAALEMPHIMLLMNDREKTVIEKLYARRGEFKKVYDFELNMNGGHVRGWLVSDIDDESILRLKRDGLLFAVGDGNHSLAAAKTCWESIKRETAVCGEGCRHEAQFALAELVNIHDESLVFEPIHRVVLGADEGLIALMREKLTGKAPLKLYFKGRYFEALVNENPADAIADIQELLDEYVADNAGVSIDYIHGDGHLLSVADRVGALAVFMPTIEKGGLFEYAARRGVLPRKSFSMGNAEDKRYYFEMRKLK